MKKLYSLLVFVSAAAFAQIPSNYYNSATGTGYTLKTQLKTIITNGHSDQGYNSLWSLYTQPAFRDNYYENNGTLLDIYSEKPNGTDSYEYIDTSDQCGNYNSEGDCYNREHLVPQSYFDDYQVNPMKNDPFHVVPSDGWVNGQRNNLPFGPVGSATYTSSNGSKKGSNLNAGYSAGFSGNVFEPIDEFKGDVARSFFYFATRYEDLMDNFYNTADGSSTQAKVMFDGTTNKVFSTTFLNILITWHQNDPVSAKEIAVNNAVYNYQGNRNPYIDHPEYVCQIWSAACNALGTDTPNRTLKVSVYPNPSSNGQINIYCETDLQKIQITNISGQTIREITNPALQNNSYQIDELPQGFYLIRISGDEGESVQKIIIN